MLNPIIAEDVSSIVEELAPKLEVFSDSVLLVTGASGFLCSYIVDVLAMWNDTGCHAPCHIIALDNLKTSIPTRLAHLEGRSDFTFVRHDVAKPFMTDASVDWIVHGASIASPMVYRKFPLETVDANVSGTRHMLDLARAKKTRSMLVMSTSEIYGDPDDSNIPTPEDYRGNVSCTGPRACYDESKRMAETLSTIYHRQYSVPVKLIRPFNVYGPGLRLDDQRVLPDFMKTVLNGRPIELLSDGRPTRAFCYVSDAIRAMLMILASSHAGEAFNVGNDEEEISMCRLAERVADIAVEVLGSPRVTVKYLISSDRDYLTDNPQRRCPDLTKTRTSFPSWRPKVTLHEGIARTLRSHLAEGTR
jgi:Nucleoside-diphosphate-sugar epimerases